MTSSIPPSLILILGALLVPLIRGRARSAYLLLLPVLAFLAVLNMTEGSRWGVRVLDYDLILGRADKLSLAFGYAFSIVSFLGMLFALRVDDGLQHMSALVYAGSALGVTFSGDFFSLYAFWELMAVSSTFLVLARRTRASQAAALRYILVHIFGGLCLLGGIVIRVHAQGSIEFDHIGLAGLDSYLIFAGIAVNAALPLVHGWLVDAYPEATATGAVFMGAITTKAAVYLMARTFAGADVLIWAGVIMALFPIAYALAENDMRRVLSYGIINQSGFMMIGIGMGTALAINGAVAHAFCCVLYTALLFMAMGSVLHVTGTVKGTDLGGLYRSMPLTCAFCMLGGASISAFPLLCGFVSKSMTISAAAHEHYAAVWLALELASAGAFLHAGLKVTYFTFFGRDAGIKAQDPPVNMLLAMGMTAALCVLIGLFPGPLYRVLPYPVAYTPYTAGHVVEQMELILFSALAFLLLLRLGLFPLATKAICLDADWFYRKGGRAFYRIMDWGLNGLNDLSERVLARAVPTKLGQLSKTPIQSWGAFYSLFAGPGAITAKQKRGGTAPEAVSLMPMGVPVLISVVFLFSLIAVFAF